MDENFKLKRADISISGDTIADIGENVVGNEKLDMNGKFIRDFSFAEIINEYANDNYYLAREFVDVNNEKPFANLDANDPIMKKNDSS